MMMIWCELGNVHPFKPMRWGLFGFSRTRMKYLLHASINIADLRCASFGGPAPPLRPLPSVTSAPFFLFAVSPSGSLNIASSPFYLFEVSPLLPSAFLKYCLLPPRPASRQAQFSSSWSVDGVQLHQS
jgi:hypothetical protein